MAGRSADTEEHDRDGTRRACHPPSRRNRSPLRTRLRRATHSPAIDRATTTKGKVMGLALSELGGGAKAWSAENINDKISGRITLVERRQQRNLDTKQLETWGDGSPR